MAFGVWEMSESVQPDKREMFAEKANEIKLLLTGLCKQDVEIILRLFIEEILPVNYFLSPPQE